MLNPKGLSVSSICKIFLQAIHYSIPYIILIWPKQSPTYNFGGLYTKPAPTPYSAK